MKKIITLAFLVFYIFNSNIYSQTKNVKSSRECVLIEGFTGINCVYCPGAATGLEQMIDEELPVAVIEYHTDAFSSSVYYTDETNARSEYYSVLAYPTTFFDGVTSHTGGGIYPSNIYSTLIGYYNSRIGEPSPFEMNLIISHISGSEYSAEISITPTGTWEGTDLRVMLAYTQSNIQQDWGNGMTHLESVCRDLIPDENGTVYTGSEQTITETFDIQDFPLDDLNVIAWIQDFDSREVYQSVIVPCNITYYEYDLKLQAVDNITVSSCSGKLAPTILVKNVGTESISSFNISVKMNDSEVFTSFWEGDTLDFNDKVSIDLEEFEFPVDSEMNLEITIESPNGNPDEDTGDNSITKIIEPSYLCNDYITIKFNTDDNPEENMVEITNMTTGEIVDQITYEQPNHNYTSRVYLDYISCYRFTVYDTGGNGISTYFSVRDNYDQLVFNGSSSVNPFSHELSFEMHSDEGITVSTQEVLNPDDILVYPNPANESVTIQGNNIESVKVFNIYGKIILDTNEKVIPLHDFSDGTYFFKIYRKSQIPVVKSIIIHR